MRNGSCRNRSQEHSFGQGQHQGLLRQNQKRRGVRCRYAHKSVRKGQYLQFCDPFRERKLLLHKREILKLLTLSQADGYSLIPLRLYLKDGKVKLELAVAKGKKLYDKRHDIGRTRCKARNGQAKCRCLLTKSSADFADCPFGSRTVYNPNPPSAHNQSCSMVLFEV